MRSKQRCIILLYLAQLLDKTFYDTKLSFVIRWLR